MAVYDAVAVITINRPEVHNALDAECHQLLEEALGRIEEDETIRVGILTGAGGRAFSAGSDMRAGVWLIGDDQPRTVTEDAEPPPRRTPMIAAIDGYCLAGGLELALRCDIRIATPSSSFGLPEPRSGTMAGYGLHMLSRMIPAGEAFYLQLTGTRIDAERAHRACLVQELVAPERLLPRAFEIAEMVTACSPLVVTAIKETIDFGLRRDLEDSYRFVRPAAEAIGRSEDAHEGPRAFQERRPPSWKGR